MVFRALENDNPDLIVVYTGNNEYHGFRALKARSDRYDPGADRCAEGCPRATSTGAFGRPSCRLRTRSRRRMMAPGYRSDGLIVTVDDDDRALGVALYREHLRNLVRAQADIPVLLIYWPRDERPRPPG